MKELVIISGKGGTGKTSMVSSIASLAENMVLCDADVDAADLHLVLDPRLEESHVFEGNWVAELDNESCTGCGACVENCPVVIQNVSAG